MTRNEFQALAAIVNSEYQDGSPVDHQVWTKYVNPFQMKRTQGGVYASLVKKGFIEITDSHGEGGEVSITQAGYDAYLAGKQSPSLNPDGGNGPSGINYPAN